MTASERHRAATGSERMERAPEDTAGEITANTPTVGTTPPPMYASEKFLREAATYLTACLGEPTRVLAAISESNDGFAFLMDLARAKPRDVAAATGYSDSYVRQITAGIRRVRRS